MLCDDKFMLESAQSMLQQSHHVKKLCSGILKNLKIEYYEYQQIDPNGEGMLLLSDESVYSDLIDLDLIGYESLYAYFMTYKKLGYYALDFMNIKRTSIQKYIYVLENHDYGHIFKLNEIVYDKLIPRIITHTFATKLMDDKLFNQHYLENINVLQKFGGFFHSQVNLFEHKIKRFKSTTQVEAKSKVIRKFKTLIKRNERELEKTDSMQNNDVLTLSKRQREIIHWYIKGKNAEETAELLNLSKRTVENHFYRLEKRYDCSTKAQLLVKFLQNDLVYL